MLERASEEARRLGHPYLGAEHVLLALTDPQILGPDRWKAHGFDPEVVGERTRALLRRGDAKPGSDPLQQTARSKRILTAAAEIGGENPIAPEDVLRALQRETKGLTARVFRETGQERAPEAKSSAGAGRTSGSRNRQRGGDTGSARKAETRQRRRGPPRSDAPPPPPPPSSPSALRAVAPTRRLGRRPGWRGYSLLIIPLSLGAAWTHQSPTIVFILAALSVIPLAGYMGEATEHLAVHTGPAVGGLLNATFGNAAELIIGIVALRAGLIELVKASILGSILGNLLLILGLSLFMGGLHSPMMKFNRTAAGMAAAMLALAVLGLTIPALFHGLHPEALVIQELHLSEAVAVILAVTYFLSLWFSLKTHSSLFSGEPHPVTGPTWGRVSAILVLGAATVGIAFESEILVHAVEPMTASIGLSQTFVGLILIPIVGNAAEHATAVIVARKGKMDLALQIALGSSTQIALLVAPLFVLAGVILGQEMNLVFAPFQVILLGLSTAVVAMITLDGESHWFEGVQLLAVYAMLVVAALFI